LTFRGSPADCEAVAKRSDQLVEQLRSQIAQPNRDPTQDEASDPGLGWARRLLHGEREPPPPDLSSSLIEALTGELAARTAVADLQWLAGLPQRPLAKAARAGLHRLRSRRVDVQLPARAAPTRGTGDEVGRSKLPCLITHYDGQAERLIWIATPSADGATVAQARLSARHGLLELHHGNLSRRNYRLMDRELEQRMPVAMVDETTAGWLIHEGARICAQQQRLPPSGYGQHQRELPGNEPGPHPAEAVPAVELDGETPRRLYELEVMKTFLPDAEALQRLALRLQEVASSRLFVDEGQRQRQREHTLTHWLEDYFDEDRLAATRRWLLDTTHFLNLLDRHPADRQLRAAASLLARPRAELLSHPFIRTFAERLFDTSSKEEADPASERSSSGLIIP
jgi:hypothetical protein